MRIGNVFLAWLCLQTAVCQVIGEDAQSSTEAPAGAPPPASGLGVPVILAGRIRASDATCADGNRSAVAYLTVQGTPVQFGRSAITCRFLSWDGIAGLRKQLGRRYDSLRPQNISADDSDAILHWMLRAPSSPANYSTQVALAGFRQSVLMEGAVSCPIPPGIHQRHPVLLSEPLGNSSAGVRILVLPDAPMRRIVVHDARPLVGPPAGQTVVDLQGEGFTDPLTCTFVNSSYAATINGTVFSSTRARCPSPAWHVPAGEGSTRIRLWVTTGGCSLMYRFTYVLDPLVVKVDPSRAPRYGALRLVVQLEDPLPPLTAEQEEGLAPLLRLQGAAPSGSDLIMAANVTNNRRSLVGVVPAGTAPLSAGSHAVHVSLDGQQFTRVGKPGLAVIIEGPTVAIANTSAYVFYPPGSASSATVEIELQGPSMLPVVAEVQVFQRALSPLGETEDDGLMEYSLDEQYVEWEAGESGRRSIMISFEGGTQSELARGALLVRVVNASNADVDPRRDTGIVTGLAADALMYNFSVGVNQVAYRGDRVSIPMNVSNAVLGVPTVLMYNITSTAGPPLSYLPPSSLKGVLRWEALEEDTTELVLPVNWTAIPPEAEYSLSLEMVPAWNAHVDLHPNATAVHIFGVQPGQCPPGTFRADNTSARLAAAPAGHAGGAWGADDARLAAILVKGPNGTVFDLSTAFAPDVAEYGVAVPQEMDAATLCVRPIQGDSLVEVYSPDGDPLDSILSADVAPPPHMDSAAVFGIRNLLGVSDTAAAGQMAPPGSAFGRPAPALAPSPGPVALGPRPGWTGPGRGARKGAPLAAAGPAAARAGQDSGVKAMATRQETDVGVVCRNNAYELPLHYGQNSFSIRVTTAAAMDEWYKMDRFADLPVASMDAMMAPHPASAPVALQSVHNGTLASAVPLSFTSMSARPFASPPFLGSPAAAPQGSRTDRYSLSIVRLADPEHAVLAELNVTDSSHATYAVCSDNPYAEQAPQDDPDVADGDNGVGECTPNTAMWLNVSSDVEWVMLQPWLRWPEVQGVRVEVDGQVLSKGGDVGADQLADTGADPKIRQDTDFLPVALILGLVPGVPLEVPIVVIAEDGVTSLRYYVNVIRAPGPVIGNLSLVDDSGDGAAGLVLGSGDARDADQAEALGLPKKVMTQRRSAALVPPPYQAGKLPPGWPVPPSRQAWCSSCPAGWASTRVDALNCEMCGPGRYAALPRSPQCSACPNGTYASSWGSTHCNHCIIGTYAPGPGSRLCLMCPDNLTNLEDGSQRCGVAVQPGTNLTMRFAVIVSFGVYLSGTSLDEIAAKVGVNASSEQILGHLVRTDTASAFNISVGDVEVTGITQIARRILYVNVSATLGVDVPPGASTDDINTALEVKNLSADDPILLLSSNPDKFFGRTTKALDVTAEPDGSPPVRTESRPAGWRRRRLALAWPAILALCFASLLLCVAAGWFFRRRNRRLYDSLLARCLPSSVARRYWRPQLADDGMEEGEEMHNLGGASSAGLISRGRGQHHRTSALAPLSSEGPRP